MSKRRIFKSRTSRQQEVRDMLRSLLIAEVIQPSGCLWLVSPWVTDLELLDNCTGDYDYLEPSWGQRKIQISELLVRAMANGGNLKIVTNKDEHNFRFLRQLKERAANYGVSEQLQIIKNKELHTKGLLGEHFYLHGSMNITIRGIEINDEQINLDTDKAEIADANLAFKSLYGGGK